MTPQNYLKERIVKIVSGKQTTILNASDYKKFSKDYYFWTNGRYFTAGHKKTGEYILLHRLIMGLKKGDGKMVDHKNGNKLDNRRSNLRICTNGQNVMNSGPTKENILGFKGVSWDKGNKIYRVTIAENGKNKHIGSFLDPIEAAKEYNRAVKIAYGEYAVLNKIPTDMKSCCKNYKLSILKQVKKAIIEQRSKTKKQLGKTSQGYRAYAVAATDILSIINNFNSPLNK